MSINWRRSHHGFADWRIGQWVGIDYTSPLSNDLGYAVTPSGGLLDVQWMLYQQPARVVGFASVSGFPLLQQSGGALPPNRHNVWFESSSYTLAMRFKTPSNGAWAGFMWGQSTSDSDCSQFGYGARGDGANTYWANRYNTASGFNNDTGTPGEYDIVMAGSVTSGANDTTITRNGTFIGTQVHAGASPASDTRNTMAWSASPTSMPWGYFWRNKTVLGVPGFDELRARPYQLFKATSPVTYFIPKVAAAATFNPAWNVAANTVIQGAVNA